MKVLYPNDMRMQKQQRQRRQYVSRRKRIGRRISTFCIVFVLLASGFGVFSVTRPVAAVAPSLVALPAATVAPLSLPWPNHGQAAVGAVGYGVVDQHNTDKPLPSASTAKIFTALMIMKAKPLKIDQQGPLITITPQDEAIYHKYVVQQGSVYPVTAGQQISEYRALQALLLPSANNIADLLAVWAYGSMSNYLSQANQYLKSLGMQNTTMVDASGFSRKTVSTAYDLTKAGELLLHDPVLAQIVAQKQVMIAGVGIIYNTNLLLADKRVIGIKTGHTDEAGGCFVIAKKYQLEDGHSITLVSAVMGATDVPAAMKSSQQIVDDAKLGFGLQQLVTEDQAVAQYQPPWGLPVEARADRGLTGVVWLPSIPPVKVDLNPVAAGQLAHASIGTVSAHFGERTDTAPVSLDNRLPDPPLSWRLYKRYL